MTLNKKCSICGYIDQWWNPMTWGGCGPHYTRVSDLDEMKLSSLNDDDCIMIVDADEKKSKQVKLLTLIQYFNKPV